MADLISAIEAGNIIGIDSCTVRRYHRKGILEAERKGPRNKLFFYPEQIKKFNKEIKKGVSSFDSLEEIIKHIFVLHEEGRSYKEVVEQFSYLYGEIDYNKISPALREYRKRRKMHFKQQLAPTKETYQGDLLFVEEVMQRLRITSRVLVHKLINDPEEKLFYPQKLLFNGHKNKYFVSKESFHDYLRDKNWYGGILFKSREVQKMADVPIPLVSTIAKRLGMKRIRDVKNSTYLFDLHDVTKISQTYNPRKS